MAVTLTNEQRSQLRQSERFKMEIKGAVFDKADYWTGLDGTDVPGGDRIKWARSRNLGADLKNVPANFQADRTFDQAIIFMRTMQVNPSNDQEVFVLDDVIDFMLDPDNNPATQTTLFESLADNIFDEQIKNRIGF